MSPSGGRVCQPGLLAPLQLFSITTLLGSTVHSFSNAPRGEKWGRTMRPEIGLKEQASERASIQVVHKVFARGGSEGHYGSSAQVGKRGSGKCPHPFSPLVPSFSFCNAAAVSVPSPLTTSPFSVGSHSILAAAMARTDLFIADTEKGEREEEKRGKQDTRIATKWLSRIFPPPAHWCFRPSGRIVTAM